ncbi:MAG: Guanylate kinase [Holosporales bacterium]
MLVLSSPSGAGKTSIAKALLEHDQNLRPSISKTTRAPRQTEIQGVDYHFTDMQTFLKEIALGNFLEHAYVFGNYYGTPKQEVDDILTDGKDVIFDIDWQGTQQLQAKCPQDLVSIFILPPCESELEKRLKSRATDSQEIIDFRMNQALNDISHFAEYDYVIINEQFEESVQKVQTILSAERLKRHRQVGMVDFVNGMRLTK